MKVKTNVIAGAGGSGGSGSVNGGGQLWKVRAFRLACNWACRTFIYFYKPTRRYTMKVKSTVKVGAGGSGSSGVDGGG